MGVCIDNGVLPSTVENLYERLSIRQFAPVAEIKAAYHELARLFHPDMHHDECMDDNELKEFLGKEFRAVQEAWDILRTPAKKAEYDRRLGLTKRSSRIKEREDVFSSFEKDFRYIPEVDSQLSGKQIRGLEYLDTLIGSGQIRASEFGELLGGLDFCMFCRDIIPKRIVTVSCRENSFYHFNDYVHKLFSHGLRAAIIGYSHKHFKGFDYHPDAIKESYRMMVIPLYDLLKISRLEKQVLWQ